MYEEPLTGLSFVVCGSVGLFLVVWGGRAIGYALLGAVAGAVLGALVYAEHGPEGFALSLPIGASVGLVIGGLIGLLLPERLSASAMRKMGIAIAVLGSVSMLAIYLGASVITCSLPTRIPPLHCLPSWGFLAGPSTPSTACSWSRSAWSPPNAYDGRRHRERSLAVGTETS